MDFNPEWASGVFASTLPCLYVKERVCVHVCACAYICVCTYSNLGLRRVFMDVGLGACVLGPSSALLRRHPWFHGLAADSKQPSHPGPFSFPSLAKLAFFPIAGVVCSKLRADGSHLMSPVTPSSAFEAPGNPRASACLMNPISFTPPFCSVQPTPASSFLTGCCSLDLKCLPRARC